MSNLRPCTDDPRVLTTTDVIQASRIVVNRGMFPHRIVVRDVTHGDRKEYVVHTERLESRAPDGDNSCSFVHWGFDNGDYTGNLEKALERFRERAGRL